MERNFNNVDFERFIKNSADQYRMYPSEKVWRGISNTLYPRKRWYGFGLALLLIGSGASTVFIANSQKTDIKDTPQTAAAITRPQSFAELNNSPKTHLLLNQQAHNIKPEQAVATKQAPSSTVILAAPVSTGKEVATKDILETNNVAVNTVEINRIPELLVDLTDQDFYYKGINTLATKIEFSENKSSEAASEKAPFTIESILNTYARNKRKHSILLQAFFTPTISYRKLTENKRYIPAGPARIPYGYPNFYNINEVVTHKPDMGLEMGMSAKYALTNGIRAKAGLQFNMTRYEIKAFNNPVEIATIALNNGYRVDSLSTFSNYRNFNGTKANWLKNFYFQVSMPVGAEVRLLGNDNIEFGVASTIQPTYILGDRAYLISSDYKNYSEVPWLIRRWNVNTSVETYLAYSTGKLNWQVGPQVRYQLLSSFVNKYPVKENLFDFGFKVGIGLNK